MGKTLFNNGLVSNAFVGGWEELEDAAIASQSWTAPSMDAAKCQVLRARLAKKATFEAALRDLQACIAADPAVACDPAVEGLVGRSFTLLRTRYSSRAFWRAGRELYAGAAEVCSGLLAVVTCSVLLQVVHGLVLPCRKRVKHFQG